MSYFLTELDGKIRQDLVSNLIGRFKAYRAVNIEEANEYFTC